MTENSFNQHLLNKCIDLFNISLPIIQGPSTITSQQIERHNLIDEVVKLFDNYTTGDSINGYRTLVLVRSKNTNCLIHAYYIVSRGSRTLVLKNGGIDLGIYFEYYEVPENMKNMFTYFTDNWICGEVKTKIARAMLGCSNDCVELGTNKFIANIVNNVCEYQEKQFIDKSIKKCILDGSGSFTIGNEMKAPNIEILFNKIKIYLKSVKIETIVSYAPRCSAVNIEIVLPKL